MPHLMGEFPMLTSPNGKGLITIGGNIGIEYTDPRTFDGIFEMKCEDDVLDNCLWLESPLNMTKIVDEEREEDDSIRTSNQRRYNHVAFWIPEELDMCQPKQDEEQDSEANQGQE